MIQGGVYGNIGGGSQACYQQPSFASTNTCAGNTITSCALVSNPDAVHALPATATSVARRSATGSTFRTTRGGR